MTTTKKLAIAVVALSLALVCAIGGTLAFLVAESNEVVNTFTYGKIEITLTETGDGDPTTSGMNFTNVVPGAVRNKKPVVTVESGSEKCYVYVLIDNQLGTAASYDIKDTWEEVATSDTAVLYRYKEVVDATSADQPLTVFEKLTFIGDLDKDAVAALDGKNVEITAYAHQADNLAENEEDAVKLADDAAKVWMEKVLAN